MNGHDHNTIHSLVPVYASLSRILKLAVEGHVGGRADLFIDIRTECEDGLAQLAMVERLLSGSGQKRRSYERSCSRKEAVQHIG